MEHFYQEMKLRYSIATHMWMRMWLWSACSRNWVDRAHVHTHTHRATSLQFLQTSLCKNGEGALHIPAGLAAVSAEPVCFSPLYSCIFWSIRSYNFLNSRSSIGKISWPWSLVQASNSCSAKVARHTVSSLEPLLSSKAAPTKKAEAPCFVALISGSC